MQILQMQIRCQKHRSVIKTRQRVIVSAAIVVCLLRRMTARTWLVKLVQTVGACFGGRFELSLLVFKSTLTIELPHDPAMVAKARGRQPSIFSEGEGMFSLRGQ